MNTTKNINFPFEKYVFFSCIFSKKDRFLFLKNFFASLHKDGRKGKNKISRFARDFSDPTRGNFIKKGVPIMWKKWKESKLCRKLKQVKINRVVYLSAVVILLALAVVLAITAATNRAKRTEEPTQTPGGITTSTTEPSPSAPGDNNDQPSALIPEMSAPVSGKLSKAHSVDVQVFSETMKDYRVHLGIDIHTEANAQVFAVADGKVSEIWQDPMMGWCIALSHSGECVTVYKNLAKDLAEGLIEGIAVKKGQLLGQVGDTALMEIADEPHLHMEMTVKGLQVDPMDYFSQAVIASLSKDTAFEEEAGK